MEAIRLLIVDDDKSIRELIAMYLQDHSFVTLEAENGREAIQLAQQHEPHLILLDVMLPDMNGFSVCRTIRQYSKVPIVFLTSKWEAGDVIEGLESGGDDYVIKPFHPHILIARVKAHLRRANVYEQASSLSFGDLQIQPATYVVQYQGQDIKFKAKEMKLLIFLAEHAKQVFHVDQLYDLLWEDAEGDNRTVMVHISNIRRKLKQYAPDCVRIETIKGIGYRLVSVDQQ